MMWVLTATQGKWVLLLCVILALATPIYKAIKRIHDNLADEV